MSDISPTQVVVAFWRWFWVAVCTAALLGAITIGLWQAHWWFFAQNVQKGYNVTTHSQQYQQSLLFQMQGHLTNISATALDRTTIPQNSPEQLTLRAQQLREITELCSESANFFPQPTPAGQQMADAIAQNCMAGAPVPNPPLANPVPA